MSLFKSEGPNWFYFTPDSGPQRWLFICTKCDNIGIVGSGWEAARKWHSPSTFMKDILCQYCH